MLNILRTSAGSVFTHRGCPSVDHIPAGGLRFPDSRACRHLGTYFSLNAAERRALGRTTINRDALMYFLGQEIVHACCVRNVTNHGAGLRLNGPNLLPFEFGISFDRFRTMRRCCLVWRDGDFVGVTFES
jgi:hypothetical protein